MTLSYNPMISQNKNIHGPEPLEFIRKLAIHVPEPCAIHTASCHPCPEPYEIIGQMAIHDPISCNPMISQREKTIHGPEPYEFMRELAIHGPEPFHFENCHP